VKIGDAAWMETLRDAVTPECDGEVRAVGLLWAVGLEQAINAWAARRIYNAAAYDSADVGMQHQGLSGMPDASGLATHVALAVTDDFVHAFEPKWAADDQRLLEPRRWQSIASFRRIGSLEADADAAPVAGDEGLL